MFSLTSAKAIYSTLFLTTTLSLGGVVESKQKQLTFVGSQSRRSKTVVFIDQSNFYHACERIGIKPDYNSLMRMLTPEVGECEIRIYLGVSTSSYKKQRELKRELKELGYQVITLPIVRYSDGSEKVVGDDIQLSCDLLTMMQNGEICYGDRVVLISADGDFKPVLQQVREKGIGVELIAYKPSRYLTTVADKITYLDQIKHKICKRKLSKISLS